MGPNMILWRVLLYNACLQSNGKWRPWDREVFLITPSFCPHHKFRQKVKINVTLIDLRDWPGIAFESGCSPLYCWGDMSHSPRSVPFCRVRVWTYKSGSDHNNRENLKCLTQLLVVPGDWTIPTGVIWLRGVANDSLDAPWVQLAPDDGCRHHSQLRLKTKSCITRWQGQLWLSKPRLTE